MVRPSINTKGERRSENMRVWVTLMRWEREGGGAGEGEGRGGKLYKLWLMKIAIDAFISNHKTKLRSCVDFPLLGLSLWGRERASDRRTREGGKRAPRVCHAWPFAAVINCAFVYRRWKDEGWKQKKNSRKDVIIMPPPAPGAVPSCWSWSSRVFCACFVGGMNIIFRINTRRRLYLLSNRMVARSQCTVRRDKGGGTERERVRFSNPLSISCL